MRMRTFVAPTLAEAMDRLREELGPDAFVIATDEPEGGPAATAIRYPIPILVCAAACPPRPSPELHK